MSAYIHDKLSGGTNSARVDFSTEKPLLVLLTGMVCDSAAWTPQMEALRDLADIMVSDYGNAETFTEMARAVLEQIPRHQRFSLAGHSMGGRIALEIYRLEPQRVERLCLIGTEHKGPPTGAAGEAETQGRLALLEIARKEGMRAMGHAWLSRLVAEANLQDASLTYSILDMLERHTPDQLEAHITAGSTRPDSTTLLGNIQCPVLVIAGEKDEIRPAKAMSETATLISGSRLVIIPDCGHMPMLEKPDVVSSLMHDWLLSAQPSMDECPTHQDTAL